MIMLIFLFLLWLTLNGRVTPEICLIGAVLALAVYLLAVFALGFSPRHEKRLWKRLGLYLVYTFVLIGEIFKASFHVMRIILTPHPNYHPAIVKVRIPLKKELSRVFLANSITLTAGTITVEERDGEFTILCLDKPSGAAIANWPLVRILKKLEEPEWN